MSHVDAGPDRTRLDRADATDHRRPPASGPPTASGPATASGSATAVATGLTRILFVVAVTVMAVRAIGYLAGVSDPAELISALLIVAYLGWLGVEIPVTFRKPTQPVAESRTLAAYAGARMLLVIAAVLPATPWSAWSAWMVPPAVMFVAGIALRVTAIRWLGRLYTHHVLRRERHPLVTDGPYRFLRHPAYAGMLLANLGFVLFFHHGSAVAALLLLGAVLVWRIRTEERVLWSVTGYPEFAAGRPRLLPGVW